MGKLCIVNTKTGETFYPHLKTKFEIQEEKRIEAEIQKNLAIKNYHIKVITGGTGSGKTYYAFQKARECGRFAYLAPTAMLAAECFFKYGTQGDSLVAKGLEVKKGSKKNHFGLYASPLPKMDEYDAIIIDEAHFAFDFAGHLKNVNNILKNFKGKIFLVTATRNFKIPELWEEICLESRVNFERKKVSLEKAIEIGESGVPTLVLCQSIKHDMDNMPCLDKAVYITAESSMLDITNALIKFKKREINFLVATNIAAQGINLSCENLIILDRKNFGSIELDYQKIGRLGRMGITEGKYLTCHFGSPDKNKYYHDDDYDYDSDDDESETEYGEEGKLDSYTGYEASEHHEFLKEDQDEYESDYTPPKYSRAQVKKILENFKILAGG